MNTQIHPTPVHYGFKHAEFRPYQREAIQAILNSSSRHVIVPAPTGSGKSLVGAVLGKHVKTRSVTHTRNLIAQYETIGAKAIYGMSYYPCVAVAGYDCDSCLFPEDMSICPYSTQCRYLEAKYFATKAEFSACSYAYFFRAKIRENPTDILYLDEAHYLPDLLMQEYEMTIKPALVERFDYEPFELKSQFSDLMNINRFASWLDGFHTNIFVYLTKLSNGFTNDNPGLAIRIKQTKGLMEKIDAIRTGIRSMPNLFLVYEVENGIHVTPLSSSPFFKPFFKEDFTKKIVLTSATIGSEVLFSKLLGIHDFDYIEVPNRFSPEEMPIYVFKDAPKLSYKSGLAENKKQLQILKQAMLDFFPDRADRISGILHFASKAETWKFLKLMNEDPFFRGRGFIHNEELSTEGKVEEWEERLRNKPNTIALSWCFHTGLDAGQVDMNMIMKTPFPAIDEKQKAMFERNPSYYRWKTANTLEQAAGRIRRGEPEHYEKPGEPTRKLVGILDMNYKKCLSATSKHFQECITLI